MKRLELTGLGNEVDITTGQAVFTAVFDRVLRIPISKEAAEILTKYIYEPAEEAPRQSNVVPLQSSEPPQVEEEDDRSGFSLGEVPHGAYEEGDDGVESI